MTRDDFLKNYWNYYLSLENRLMNTTNYVAIDKCNEDTFSNEYAILVQAIGGELDSFFKEYCGFQPDDKKTITDYAIFILNEYPDIVSQNIVILGTDEIITPYNGWKGQKPKQELEWWCAYDNTKHSRCSNKKEACQKNVLSLLGALYLIEMRFLLRITKENDEPDIPDKPSQLFSLQGWKHRYTSLANCYAVDYID